MQHIWGWVKVMGDLGILPYPGATGTTGTQICTRRLSHFFPSTLYSKEAPAEEEEAGEAPAMLSRRETRLLRIKVQSYAQGLRSWLAWVPKGCREGAWGVTLLQGSGNNSQEALQEIFRAKVKGHLFSSQEASSLQACPSLHVCLRRGGALPPPQGGCDSWQKDGQEIAGELCLLTRRAGASGLGFALSKHGFPQK